MQVCESTHQIVRIPDTNFFKKYHSTTGETEVRIKQIADFLCVRNSQIFYTREFAGFFHIFYVDFYVSQYAYIF